MKRMALLLVALASALPADAPKVSRDSLAALERSLDQRVERLSVDDPFTVLVSARGVYLEGFGAVFTSEVNLAGMAVMSPFRPAFTKEQIAAIRTKKLQRVGILRQTMMEMMVTAAGALDGVPQGEQIAIDVSLFYHKWEDINGLPREILMQASRQALLAARSNPAALQAAIKVREH